MPFSFSIYEQSINETKRPYTFNERLANIHNYPISWFEIPTMPQHVLMGVGGQLGSLAAESALEIANPDQKLVLTSHNVPSIPIENTRRWIEAGAEITLADYDNIESLQNVFIDAQAWKYCGNKWTLNSNDVPAAYVAREDCARVAAALLLGKGEHKSIYDVTGPEAMPDSKILTYMCMTRLEAEIQSMTNDELEKYWDDKGLPRDASGDFSKSPMNLCVDDVVSCGDVVAGGLMSNTTDTVERLTGRKPLSV